MLCQSFERNEERNGRLVSEVKSLVRELKNRVEEESKRSEGGFVGEVDPNRQLKADAEELLTGNLIQGVNARDIVLECLLHERRGLERLGEMGECFVVEV